ncbi:MAG: hypothetical protein KUG61_00780 [Parvibaculaceae bacterium]|nr:hypothetical protein [Parvibaculaceae bacterium]
MKNKNIFTYTKTSGALFGAILLMATGQSAFAMNAVFKGGEQDISLHERASFPVQTNSTQTSEFTAWCEVTSLGGSATVMFDGDGYVPLSDPNVGDMIMLQGGVTQRLELTGTFEANQQGEIAFYFSNIPAGFCFTGQNCAKVEDGGDKVNVKCGAH